MSKGRLTIIGSGMHLGHLTTVSKNVLLSAEKVFFVVSDPVTTQWILTHGRDAESLAPFYEAGGSRSVTYERMAGTIVDHVRLGKHVCAVFYGHPGVFVAPSHEAIRQARAEGFEAEMQPGISAEDCLFADLGIDPCRFGCQSYEATDFLVHRRRIDNSALLILWQVGVVGYRDYRPGGYDRRHVPLLVDVLKEQYPVDHIVTLYEASMFPGVCPPKINQLKLGELCDADLTPISTLCVPPSRELRADRSTLARLGFEIPAPSVERADSLDG